MPNPADARRRWFGAFYLIVALSMLVWGQTVLKSALGRGWIFLLYWLACFAFTGLAMVVALRDFYIMRRRIRDQQNQLLQQTFSDIQNQKSQTDNRKNPKKNQKQPPKPDPPL